MQDKLQLQEAESFHTNMRQRGRDRLRSGLSNASSATCSPAIGLMFTDLQLVFEYAWLLDHHHPVLKSNPIFFHPNITNPSNIT